MSALPIEELYAPRPHRARPGQLAQVIPLRAPAGRPAGAEPGKGIVALMLACLGLAAAAVVAIAATALAPLFAAGPGSQPAAAPAPAAAAAAAAQAPQSWELPPEG
ncbi:MAG: hypothetical protein LBQ92_01225 [Propionibacteriaceae bacterium]|jgi:uncharacterized iron-regulated membrane protein|nr:hypothetical protein [Propionibacteriaceae bacterium]